MHYRELIGTWARRNSLPQDAEDAAQDTAANLLSGGEQTAVLDHKSYLYRAANNRLISEIRRQARHPLQPLDQLAPHEHPASDGPEAALQAAELARALRSALQELPPKCQQVFLWNKLEGYTQSEIAHKLGLTQSMVEKHMKRALRHLQEKLQNYASH